MRTGRSRNSGKPDSARVSPPTGAILLRETTTLPDQLIPWDYPESERPGLADTESISEDFSTTDLKSIVPFYEAKLPKASWVEDPASVGTAIVRFTKGTFVLSIAIDPPSSGYTVTVDHVNPNLFGPPSPTPTPSTSTSP